MKKNEIKIGGHYVAKVSDSLVTVRVDAIRETTTYRRGGYGSRPADATVYDVTILKTGRKTTFRSAAKFRREVKDGETTTGAKSVKGTVANPLGRSAVAPPTVAKPVGRFAEEEDPCRPETVTECECRDVVASPGEQCEVCGGTVPFAVSAAPLSPPVTATESTGSPVAASATPAAPSAAKSPSLPSVKTEKPLSPMAAHLAAKAAQAAAAPPAPSSKNPPHVIVLARAGTGKTTTLVCGLQALKGIEPFVIVTDPETGAKSKKTITPSPQQKAVWDAIAESKGARSVCFVAFNKSIATELKERVPAGCDAMTMHSMGFRAVGKAFQLKGGNNSVNQYRVQDIIAELLGKDIREIRRTDSVLLKATEDLVALCKQNLTGLNDEVGREYGAGTSLVTISDDDILRLAAHYDVEMNGSQKRVLDLVPRVLERCLDVNRDGCIDFNDMIWIPVVLNLPLWKNDLLLVDEAQDLNRCQQALAKKAGNRLILCGDDRQAIYGFAGADAESLPRMKAELGATSRGVKVLPLTVTRRCGKAIVEEARRIVKDFEAHESNAAGEIAEARYPIEKIGESRREVPVHLTYIPQVVEGDFILCRVNAPLVSQCFRFLKMGRKANIQGRDIGAGIISTIKKVGKTKDVEALVDVSVEDLISGLGDWQTEEVRKEQAKKNPSEARLIALEDRYACICCFCDEAKTALDVVRKVESVFTDDRKSPGIRLSSIHKAKGLEAKRVFLLIPEDGPVPHPMAKSAWQREQEMNLLYVAMTRAIEKLTYVS